MSAIWLAVLGACGAIAAAALVWSAAAFSNFPGDMAWILETHRWLGVGTAATAVLAATAGVLALRRGAGWPFFSGCSCWR